jgi:hypothetical protein
MILATRNYESARRAALITIPLILVISLSAWTLSKPLGVLLSGEQQCELLIIKWHPGSNPLTNTEVQGLVISQSDLDRLKAIGLTGEVMYSGSARYGKGQRARAIIVTQAPLSEPVNLPQPAGSQVIYVQSQSGWHRFPSEAPTSHNQIRLWTDLQGSSQNTRFSLERSDGSRQSGTAATW